MKILITGGAGFIGSNLTKRLLKEGHTVYVVDNFNDYYDPLFKKQNIKGINHSKFKLIKADIANYSRLSDKLKGNKFDKIIHLAASVGVRNSLLNPELHMKTNIEGTLNMLKLANELQVKDFIFASSSSVYGSDTIAPFKENSACTKPISPYAASKRAAELLCYTYQSIFDLNITIHRFFTVYGPSGRPDMAPYIFTKAILNGDPIPLFGTGEATRDFTFVDDIVDGIILSLNKPFKFEIFNLGNSAPITILEFIKALEKVIGKKANLEMLETKVGDMAHTHADTNKAYQLLGFKAKTNLKDGLTKFVEWYRKERLTV